MSPVVVQRFLSSAFGQCAPDQPRSASPCPRPARASPRSPVALPGVAPHGCGVRRLPHCRRVKADGLPLDQACIGQSLQHPGEDCLATRARDRRMVPSRLFHPKAATPEPRAESPEPSYGFRGGSISASPLSLRRITMVEVCPCWFPVGVSLTVSSSPLISANRRSVVPAAGLTPARML